MIIIIFIGMPIVGFKDFVLSEPVMRAGLFYGQVKGISISPEMLKINSKSAQLSVRLPVRVDVYFSSPKYKTKNKVLEKMGIVVFPEDHIDFFPDPKLGVGTRVTVLRARSVKVDDNGRKEIFRTWAQTVGELLSERELDLNINDKISVPITSSLSRNMSIKIARANNSQIIERFVMPFQVVVKDDPWLPSGKVRIAQQGENGERRRIWQVIMREGKEIRRMLVSDSIFRPKQDRIVMQGTKSVHFEGPYYDWILAAAEEYSADPDQMYRVMMCESGGDPYAVSPSGRYVGLFQYDKLTWSVSGWGDHDRRDPYAQIFAAAKAWKSRYTKWPITSKICGDLGKW